MRIKGRRGNKIRDERGQARKEKVERGEGGNEKRCMMGEGGYREKGREEGAGKEILINGWG